MRIISGIAQGRKIEFPKLKDIRPTTDKVREAIFNIIGDISNESVVLDLFSGSGSFGLEALSRGASFVVFNDKEKEAIKIIKKNIKILDFNETSYIIYQKDCFNLLKYLKNNEKIFSYIYLDPPYNFKEYKKLLEEVFYLSNPETSIILEVFKKTEIITPKGLVFQKIKKYGDNKVLFFKKEELKW